MWALGVVLFTMLYGQFPFYDSIPQELFRKIKAAEYTIPEDGRVSENTVCLIRKLLVLDPQQRLAAADVLEALSAIIASWQRSQRNAPSTSLRITCDSSCCWLKRRAPFTRPGPGYPSGSLVACHPSDG